MFTVLRNGVVHARLLRNVRYEFSTTVQCLTQQPQLSPYDVNLILKENEFTYTMPRENESTIHSYESNYLASNKPCEDSHTEASFHHKNAFICGIFDGHAGPSCAQVVSKRLIRYIAASLTERSLLNDLIVLGCNSESFLKCYNDKVDFVKEIKDIYERNFTKFLQKISSDNQKQDDKIVNYIKYIKDAFLQLDNDLSDEALNDTNIRTMAIAMSGAVACVAYVEGLDLYVAGAGDCMAVLGSQCINSGQWSSKRLTIEHNTDNHNEVKRILAQHPNDERDTVIRNDRLLGQLAPLRALGDFRYKWSNKIMDEVVITAYGENVVPSHYYTPPYLTAEPDVEYHRLTISDKFLVIASDGLWDFLTPSQVVRLIADHVDSKLTLNPVKLPNGDPTLKEISKILAQRRAGRTRKSIDQNSTTHLIRHALGATDFGIEHSKISYYLSLPQDVVRFYRDDITITVVYFNTDNITALYNK